MTADFYLPVGLQNKCLLYLPFAFVCLMNQKRKRSIRQSQALCVRRKVAGLNFGPGESLHAH